MKRKVKSEDHIYIVSSARSLRFINGIPVFFSPSSSPLSPSHNFPLFLILKFVNTLSYLAKKKARIGLINYFSSKNYINNDDETIKMLFMLISKKKSKLLKICFEFLCHYTTDKNGSKE